MLEEKKRDVGCSKKTGKAVARAKGSLTKDLYKARNKKWYTEIWICK